MESIITKFKNYFKKTKLYPYLLWIKFVYFLRKNPDKTPSFLEKRDFIVKLAKETKIPVFIETGTYLGDMIYSVKDIFKEIYSIELDKKLAERANKIFKKYNHIHIINGDSSEVLPKLLLKINRPVQFWLDAHYSGGITTKGDRETPILEELNSILNWWINGSIILIDDARLFKKENDWPEIRKIFSFINKKNQKLRIEIINDIIMIK